MTANPPSAPDNAWPTADPADADFAAMLAECHALDRDEPDFEARRDALTERVFRLLLARMAVHRELFPTLWAQGSPHSRHMECLICASPLESMPDDKLVFWSIFDGRFECTIDDQKRPRAFKTVSIPEAYLGVDGVQVMRADAATFNSGAAA
ncbi:MULTISPECIES: hypothetical protein [unclassified Variovorax]|uniref:hypothetical protein n=1 Tax=unclassified Variovorax TaxID=663243 RepID=UPI00076CF65B|nr:MULTISPECIES: hypothetical protein [unclassified Variovorax]KWT95583.1 hypothetical protein APY03_2460 [Variovorax sp. WDL1]PNG50195.1 hypothetical protein CHC06_05818 [Variovorax sp. B2]PNG51068.1 hypothetical protein CHC07_05724 [Variovorax sp. B4]VTU42292.1 hypothetical protein SRS16P1_00233 [Variovorax sp. SRS16]VTU42317.1 hypothetical protein E5P1_00231 [Variovorax sp. PBL-E5]